MNDAACLSGAGTESAAEHSAAGADLPASREPTVADIAGKLSETRRDVGKLRAFQGVCRRNLVEPKGAAAAVGNSVRAMERTAAGAGAQELRDALDRLTQSELVCSRQACEIEALRVELRGLRRKLAEKALACG